MYIVAVSADAGRSWCYVVSIQCGKYIYTSYA
eukprot:SAG22_NODE_876_length_6716_cov_2.126190_4_plen_32_part_00